MLTNDDFKVADVSSSSVSVIYVPTGQIYCFEAIRGALVVGTPLITGAPTDHPPWLMSWLARQTAQFALTPPV